MFFRSKLLKSTKAFLTSTTIPFDAIEHHLTKDIYDLYVGVGKAKRWNPDTSALFLCLNLINHLREIKIISIQQHIEVIKQLHIAAYTKPIDGVVIQASTEQAGALIRMSDPEENANQITEIYLKMSTLGMDIILKESDTFKRQLLSASDFDEYPLMFLQTAIILTLTNITLELLKLLGEYDGHYLNKFSAKIKELLTFGLVDQLTTIAHYKNELVKEKHNNNAVETIGNLYDSLLVKFTASKENLANFEEVIDTYTQLFSKNLSELLLKDTIDLGTQNEFYQCFQAFVSTNAIPNPYRALERIV